MPDLSTLAFTVIVLTAMIILVFREWRFSAGALAVQYLAVFYLVSLSWPISLAVVKLIVGWMATAAIGLTCMRQMGHEEAVETCSESIPFSPRNSVITASKLVLSNVRIAV